MKKYIKERNEKLLRENLKMQNLEIKENQDELDDQSKEAWRKIFNMPQFKSGNRTVDKRKEFAAVIVAIVNKIQEVSDADTRDIIEGLIIALRNMRGENTGSSEVEPTNEVYPIATPPEDNEMPSEEEIESGETDEE
jgi:hypothetical protein